MSGCQRANVLVLVRKHYGIESMFLACQELGTEIMHRVRGRQIALVGKYLLIVCGCAQEVDQDIDLRRLDGHG